MEPIKVPLSKPIEAHGEKVKALELKEPTGEDLMACGLPYSLGLPDEDSDASSTMGFNTHACAKLISRMAGIPLGSIKKMSAPDFQRAITDGVMPFFNPESTHLEETS